MRTTVLLLLGVGAVVAAIGVGTAWLVTVLPLSRPARLRMGAAPAARRPDLHRRLRLSRRDASDRAGADDAPRAPRHRAPARPLVPRDPLARRLHLPARLRALPLRLPAGARALPDAVGARRSRWRARSAPGRCGVFFRVALPLARPAIAVGVSLALMEALNDIGASEFLGIRTLTVAIYTTWTVRMSVEGAAQIALVMLAVVFAPDPARALGAAAAALFRPGAAAAHADAAAARRLRGAAAATLACAAADPLRLPRPGELSRRRVLAALSGSPGMPRALAGVDREQRDASRPSRRSSPSSSAWCSPIPCACRAIPPRRRSCGSPRSATRCPAPCSPSACSCRSPRSTITSTPPCAPPSASPPACSSPARARRWSSPMCSASSPSRPAASRRASPRSARISTWRAQPRLAAGKDAARHPPAAARARRSPPRRCSSSSTA